MKSTIRISKADTITVEPSSSHVKIRIQSPLLTVERTLSTDQASAIVFALEQALDVVQANRNGFLQPDGCIHPDDVPY